MRHCDSVDPAKMEIEGSATFSSNGDSDRKGTSHEADLTSSSSVNAPPSPTSDTTEENREPKRKAEEKRGDGNKCKRRRRDTQARDASSPDQWQARFLDMWERSVEEENARFERSAQMFREAQNRQMEQTNGTLAGFKDIFKDLASKE